MCNIHVTCAWDAFWLKTPRVKGKLRAPLFYGTTSLTASITGTPKEVIQNKDLFVHTYIHTYIHAYIHPSIHTHIHTYIYIYICIYIYVYIYIVHPKSVDNSRCARTNPASLQVPNWRLRLSHENHSGLEILGS